ncbi:MAG: dihydroorotate dehydrogenase [Thermoplasmataceae archaeon]
MVYLSVNLKGLKLGNPLILASGILDENGYTIKAILDQGAGAAVTKSIGMMERTGYRPPVVAEVRGGLLNAVGLPNPGIENFGDEIKIALKSGKPVIGSIFGSDTEEFVYLAKKMEMYGVEAIELNLSCPHVKGFGSEVGSDPDLVEEIVNDLKKKIRIPIFAKLSPNVTDVVEIAKAAQNADAIVLINTVRGMAVDIYARKPILTNTFGGLSGHSIKPVGVRYVYEVKKETGKTVIGVGGISDYTDAIEYIMAGSSAVQIGTALYTEGKEIFNTINRGIRNYMKEEKFETIDEMVGAAI